MPRRSFVRVPAKDPGIKEFMHMFPLALCTKHPHFQGWALSSIIQENMLMARTYKYVERVPPLFTFMQGT
jgi:hypothetical protein